MSDIKKDGGPAFPQQPFIKPNGDIDWGTPGMTLRDWFAGMALNIGEGVWEGKHDNGFQEMAQSCYRIADAMLFEREKGTP